MGKYDYLMVGWLLLVAGGVLYHVRRIKHPSRSLLQAFLVFAGTFGGISGAAVAGAVWFMGLFPATGKSPAFLGPLLAFGVVHSHPRMHLPFGFHSST